MVSAVVAAQEHGLNDEAALEFLEQFDDPGDGTVVPGLVDMPHGGVDGGVEFEDIPVYAQQGFAYSFAVDHRGVAQHGDFGRGGVTVSEGEGGVDDPVEVGMHGGFAVPCEGDDVGQFPLFAHGFQLRFEGGNNFSVRIECAFAVRSVPTAFAIDAVEVAELGGGGEQIHSQGGAESAAMNRPDYNAVE